MSNEPKMSRNPFADIGLTSMGRLRERHSTVCFIMRKRLDRLFVEGDFGRDSKVSCQVLAVQAATRYPLQ